MRRSSQAQSDCDVPWPEVRRAKRYSRIKLAVWAGSTAWHIAQLAWFAADRRSARLKTAVERRAPDRRWVSPAFFGTATALSWAFNLPTGFVGGYLVERGFGLTRQTRGEWVTEQIKVGLAAVALQTPVLSAAYQVIGRWPRDWWLILAAAAVPLTIAFSNLAPVILLPLFNRFEPLRQEELAHRVRALSERGGISVADVYVVDMSRQSEKPNAFFTGIGQTKRIVLGDTLLRDFTPDEIEAIVAHEIGHQVHGDIWRLIGFGCGLGFGLSWILSRSGPAVLRLTIARTGVSEISDIASFPVLAVLMSFAGLALMPAQAAFSRRIERRADRFAIDLTGNPEALATALEKLAEKSLADPDPPRPVVVLLYSHPPFAERVRRARGEAKTADDWSRPVAIGCV